MSITLFVVGIGVVRLDAILAERNEDVLVEEDLRGRTDTNNGFFGKVRAAWAGMMTWVKDTLERWAIKRDDKQVAWTLGIGWACLGGGLAGECLVFAKAT
jgi:hypothetical protein